MSADYRDLLIEHLHDELTALATERDTYRTMALQALAQLHDATRQLRKTQRQFHTRTNLHQKAVAA